MERAIAMKCNQEQFDAIKGKLAGCKITMIDNFSDCDYLANRCFEDQNKITNFEAGTFSVDREVYETWNERIFLEACGIETEKIFKGSELQYWDEHLNEWRDCMFAKYRIKPTEILEYEKQIEELKEKINKLKQ